MGLMSSAVKELQLLKHVVYEVVVLISAESNWKLYRYIHLCYHCPFETLTVKLSLIMFFFLLFLLLLKTQLKSSVPN